MLGLGLTQRAPLTALDLVHEEWRLQEHSPAPKAATGPFAPPEYKTSYVRSRAIRSVVSMGLPKGLEGTFLPRNLTKRHWPGTPEDQDKDGGDFSGTGGLPDYSAPNPIKVTHR